MALNPVYMMEFDPATLARMDALMGGLVAYAAYYRIAMDACTQYVKSKAGEIDYAPVKTGALRRGLMTEVPSPWLGRVGVSSDIRYARRREFGFDNQIDRLGRHYRNGDPLYSNPDLRAHMFYLRRALIASEAFILQAFSQQTMMTFRAMNAV